MKKIITAILKTRLFKIALILLLTAIVAVSGFYLTSIVFSSYQLEYGINSISVKDQSVDVVVKITRNPMFGKTTFMLADAVPAMENVKCVDDLKADVKYEEKDGLISIGPVPQKAKFVEFSYKVKMDMQGNSAAMYDDMVVFNGESVLLFPYFSTDAEIDGMNKAVNKVSINVNKVGDWNVVLPYQKVYNVKQKRPIVINNPDWYTFYNLSKSCYAFGNFNEIKLDIGKGKLSLLIDPKTKLEQYTSIQQVISNLCQFYTERFGSMIENYPVMLLRNNPLTNTTTIGGVSGKTLGISFNPDSVDDWQTLSHSLYTAFFDSKVKIRNIHYPPNLWLYKGLATYYEKISANLFPDPIKEKSEVKPEQSLDDLYSRYLFFRLKEPGIFKISPANEGQLTSAQMDFFYYTEAPLVVKAIEDVVKTKTSKSDNLLRYLLAHAKDKQITLGRAMTELLGENEETIRNYLAGEKIIPFSRSTNVTEEPFKVVEQINKYELSTYNRFTAEGYDFPADKEYLLDMEKVLDEADKRNVKFASDDIEKIVKDYSITLYVLLKQHALRADECGIKDLTDPELRNKLCGDEANVKKWENLIEKLGGVNEKTN